MTFLKLSSNGYIKTETVPNATVLCLGNFDGVHIGHARLVCAALEKKRELKQRFPDIMAGAWLFEPLPAEFLCNCENNRCRIITQLPDKLEIFASLGLDFVILADFKKLSHLSPDSFVSDILVNKANAAALVCGFNYRFGYRAEGDAVMLSQLFRGDVTVIKQVLCDGDTVSSSRIRELITAGDVKRAAILCGRPFFISSEVVHGAAVGRTLGFPTVNQPLGRNSVIPAHGVYVSRCVIDGKVFPAITNIGVRPTLYDKGEIVCETHLLGFNGGLYGAKIKTELLEFLRPERKFASPEELISAVVGDIAAARKYHGII